MSGFDFSSAVPGIDAATNVETSDVVGNKSDTVGGTSLVSLALQAQADQEVPGADSVANIDTSDVVGNKLDTIAGDSLYALALQSQADQEVPGADSAANIDSSDVVGDKTDTIAGDSLYALALQLQADHEVPGADSAVNNDVSDVVGDKTDTIAGDSLYALALQSQADQEVPGADAADNADVADVVGQKGDSVAGDSLYALALRVHEGVNAIECFPTGAAGVQMTSGAAWVDGAWFQIAAAGPAADFKIVGFGLDTPTAPQVGEVVLAYGAGAAEVEVARIPYEIASDVAGYMSVMIPPTGVIAGGTRIAATIATGGGADLIGLKMLCQEV